MKITYRTRGTCSRKIDIEVEDGIIKEVKFTAGCDGNLKGISQLVKGMKTEDVMKRMDGITCGLRKTSCPDQLAKALSELK
ncbi:MAG: TIGR03905 family TSCPD domain-containing protein [Oscillospiraceae bacterium]|nr:TIGR03905 family TSCPD domain-containing protein [Oscillospiraceae bacterium]